MKLLLVFLIALLYAYYVHAQGAGDCNCVCDGNPPGDEADVVIRGQVRSITPNTHTVTYEIFRTSLCSSTGPIDPGDLFYLTTSRYANTCNAVLTLNEYYTIGFMRTDETGRRGIFNSCQVDPEDCPDPCTEEELNTFTCVVINGVATTYNACELRNIVIPPDATTCPGQCRLVCDTQNVEHYCYPGDDFECLGPCPCNCWILLDP